MDDGSASEMLLPPAMPEQGRSYSKGPRFGYGSFRNHGIAEAAIVYVAGPSENTAGFELLGVGGKLIAWYACLLDACDGMRARRGTHTIVRCSDRALMKRRASQRWK